MNEVKNWRQQVETDVWPSEYKLELLAACDIIEKLEVQLAASTEIREELWKSNDWYEQRIANLRGSIQDILGQAASMWLSDACCKALDEDTNESEK